MKLFYGLLIFFSFVIGGCKHTKTEEKNNEEFVFQIDSVDKKTGLQRMQVSKVKQEITLQNKKYELSIQRTPADSLPQVKVDGGLFADNIIKLAIHRQNGTKLLVKTFTKKDFAAQLPDTFLKYAVLEGIVYDDEVSEDTKQFTLAASVCVPMSDIYVPFSIKIAANGSYTIQQDESMEEVPMSAIIGEEEAKK